MQLCIYTWTSSNCKITGWLSHENVLTLPGGLEPPTFRLTAERANQLRHGSCIHVIIDFSLTLFAVKLQNFSWWQKPFPPTVGFEPTTFGLEVQRASPLRHAGPPTLWINEFLFRWVCHLIHSNWMKKCKITDDENITLCNKIPLID